MSAAAAGRRGRRGGAVLKPPLDNLNALSHRHRFRAVNKDWQQLYTQAQEIEEGFPFKDGSGGEVIG